MRFVSIVILSVMAAVLFGQAINTVAPVRYATAQSHVTLISGGPTCTDGDTPTVVWATNGDLYVTQNDGCGGGVTSNVLISKITALSPLTISLTNSMTGWGTAGQGGIVDTNVNHTTKSAAVWYNGGNLYMNIFAQSNGDPFVTYRAMIIKSEDNGATWKNWARIQASDSGQANGDPCPASGTTQTIGGTPYTCVQWQGTNIDDSSGTMAKLALIWTNQDGQSVPSPAPPNMDTNYLYFLSVTGTTLSDHTMYVHAVKKSDENADPSKWKNWDGSTSCATPASWTGVVFPADGTTFNVMPTAWLTDITYSVSVMYSPDYKQYFLVKSLGVYPMAHSTSPCGPWVIMPQMTSPSSMTNFGFPSFIYSTYATVTANGRFTIKVMANGTEGDDWDNSMGYWAIDFNLPNNHSGAIVVR